MPDQASLSGVRIWLSGSIPKDATPEQSERLKAFVKSLAQAAFREGARIVHGFHPSLTPALLQTARAYRESTDRRAPLSLFVSTFFRDPATSGYEGIPVANLEADCELQQIPQGTSKDHSLEELRRAMASQADVLVAIGGKWWEHDRDNAGVPAEFLLAIARGIPVFLLAEAGGGATRGYLDQRPEILNNLRNGLDAKANAALAAETDVDRLTSALLQQMTRLPLGRRETASGQRFRILSLDGGGIRGAFTAAVLAQWEEMSKLRVADHFDLIAGTSTGGILAIGLGLGMSALEVLDFYRNQGPQIFPKIGTFDKILRAAYNVAGAKFEASDLEAQLSLAFDRNDKVATLKHSRQRLLITSYDLTGNRLKRYRTSHHPDVEGHDNLRAVIVGRATSAAPTYFAPAKVEDPIARYEAVDGGVWANCPALAAIGEATGVLRVPLDRIDLLSVGTAGMPEFVTDPLIQGKAGWGPKAPDLFMNAQMDSTQWMAEQLVGDRFVRVDDPSRRVTAMDNPDDLDYLIVRGAGIGEEWAKLVLRRFVNGVSAASWRQV